MDDQQARKLADLTDQYPCWCIRPTESGRLVIATRRDHVDTLHTPLRMTIMADTPRLLANELGNEAAKEVELRERSRLADGG